MFYFLSKDQNDDAMIMCLKMNLEQRYKRLLERKKYALTISSDFLNFYFARQKWINMERALEIYRK